jgi:hypothetical protein
MKRLEPIRLPGWAPPLLIAAAAVPIVAAFALGGPPAGLAAGALAVTALLVFAARARYLEPIAVASSPGDRFRLLVVALADVDEPDTARAITRIADAGADATGLDRPEVLVLAPAPTSGLARWASDLEGGRYEAQRRLAVSLAALSAAGADVSGRVGDPEPLQATEDVLCTFPAQEVAFVTPDDSEPEAARALDAVRRRLDRPVRSLAVS